MINKLNQSFHFFLSYEIKKNNYKTVHLVQILEELKEKNQNNQTSIWSIINDKGIVNEDEEHSEKVTSKDISNYKLVFPNNFVYNFARINGRFFKFEWK